MYYGLYISMLVLAGALLPGCNQKLSPQDESPKSDNAEQSLEESQNPTLSSNPLVERFLALTSAIASRENELNREKERRVKLRQELLGHSSSSCALDKDVRTLEFFINGASRSDFDVSSLYQDANGLAQNAQTNSFTVIIGEANGRTSASFTNDEMKESLFVPGGRKLITPDIKLKIGDLKQVKIVRASSSYKIADPCLKSDGKPVEACTTPKEVKEIGRVEMSSIRIKVNGYLLYEKSVKHVFGKDRDKDDGQASSGLSWSDDNLQTSDSFNRLTQINDCSQL